MSNFENHPEILKTIYVLFAAKNLYLNVNSTWPHARYLKEGEEWSLQLTFQLKQLEN